ncbi:MAG: glycosyltransferase family 4 protein [Pirellulaceae bacterium]
MGTTRDGYDDAAVHGGPRLFLDCSMTAQSTELGGVERVVRNVAASIPAIARADGIESRIVVFRDGHWRDLPTALERFRSCPPPNFAGGVTRGMNGPVDGLPAPTWTQRFGKRLYKIAYPRTLVRSARRLTINLLGKGGPIPDFRPEDILLLLDGSWLMPETPRFEAARRAGTRLGLVVYDLLPISHPQFMLQKAQRQFTRWMRRIVPQMDFFLAISQTIRDEFRTWAWEAFPEHPIDPERVSWFPLGVKLDMAAPQGDVRPAVRGLFDENGKTYVKVCTLDPRKNHAVVMEAFELVWRQSPTTRLCFIGRQGWMCSELVRQITSHPRLGKQLFWFQGLTDAELVYCFGHAHGAVFASLAEGYGLPIVESLRYGLPTFVSDIPVHREVGSDFCVWFDPRQPESLADLLLTHLRTGAFPSRRPRTEYLPTTWEAATRVLVHECRRLAAVGAGDRFRRAG